MAKNYTVVYGAKCVGKSTIIGSAVKGRRGVLLIRVPCNTSKEDITRMIARTTGTTTLNPENGDFFAAMRIGLGDDGTIPTIIFEIDRGTSVERMGGLQTVRSLAEEFSVVCTVILVLSEASAAPEFDVDRAEFIYVEEFTELEARQYFTALGMKLSDADIKYYIANVGANPLAIFRLDVKMTEEGMSVQEFVAWILMGYSGSCSFSPQGDIEGTQRAS